MEEKLSKEIEEKRKKVARLNAFEKYMHFMDDVELVEMYEVIHREEQSLKKLQEKLLKLPKQLEDEKQIDM